MIRQHGDDHLARPELLGDLKRHGHVRAGRAAAEEAFLLYQAARQHEAVAIVHLTHVVNDGEIHRATFNVFADALDHIDVRRWQRFGVEEMIVHRAQRIGPDDLHVRRMFFEKAANA